MVVVVVVVVVVVAQFRHLSLSLSLIFVCRTIQFIDVSGAQGIVTFVSTTFAGFMGGLQKGFHCGSL